MEFGKYSFYATLHLPSHAAPAPQFLLSWNAAAVMPVLSPFSLCDGDFWNMQVSQNVIRNCRSSAPMHASICEHSSNRVPVQRWRAETVAVHAMCRDATRPDISMAEPNIRPLVDRG